MSPTDLSERLDPVDAALASELRAAYLERTAHVHPSARLESGLASLRPVRTFGPLVPTLAAAAAAVAAVATIAVIRLAADPGVLAPAAGMTSIVATAGPSEPGEPGFSWDFEINTGVLPTWGRVEVRSDQAPPADAAYWGTDGIRYRRASAPGGWSTVWGQVPRVTDPAWIAISSDQLTVEQLIDALRSMKSAPATAKSPCPATACG